MKNVLVTGGAGLVGDATTNELSNRHRHKYDFVSLGGKRQRDLRNREEVDRIFRIYEPNYVIHAAANVGGVGGNKLGHGQYLYDNLLMNSHVIDVAVTYKVEKLLAFSSVCVFPDEIGVLTEDNMHKGEPSPFNFAYAYAKRMIDIQIEAYKQQYKIDNYCSIIPCNIFGPNDWYNIEKGHVIPSLMHKLFMAKTQNIDFVIWGDGNSLREFIFAPDLAIILVELLGLAHIPQRLIVSNNERQYSIRDLVDILVKIAGFKGRVIYDTRMPNGQHSRPTDTSLLKSILPNVKFTPMEEAVGQSWDWFCSHYPNVRL